LAYSTAWHTGHCASSHAPAALLLYCQTVHLYCLLRQLYCQLLYCLLLGFTLERPLYLVLKNVCRRDRPEATLKIPSFIIPSDRFSFPSGHTSAAFLVATLVSAFYPALAPLLFSWAIMVGMARVILGVHFPTDTLIGAVMGSTLALASMEYWLK
jgi:undecaprenyl-diphosphatase